MAFKTFTHMQKLMGIDTVSYAVTLANHNSGHLLTGLKVPVKSKLNLFTLLAHITSLFLW